jgi:hypothetical protein
MGSGSHRLRDWRTQAGRAGTVHFATAKCVSLHLRTLLETYSLAFRGVISGRMTLWCRDCG